MPCNNQQSLGNEVTASVSDSDALPSSSLAVEGRQVNISPEATVIQTNEQKTVVRTRTVSSRSISNYGALLPGEDVDSENFVEMESCQVYVTQFRIIIISNDHCAICAVPLTGIDMLEAKDIVGLHIGAKDGRIIKLRAENAESACSWYKKLMQKACVSRELDTIFAFQFFRNSVKRPPIWLRKDLKKLSSYEQLHNEFRRFKLAEDKWRISVKNESFEICSTYPQFLIVPKSVSDEDLKQMSYGRYYRRFPALVWRNKRNGALLLRSSQPSIGFFGLTNEKDVTHYERIRATISTDPNTKFLIVDARSYTAAWANRAKGGGFEGSDTYPNADVIFMGLPNIHNIRYSFRQLRQILNNASEPNIFLQHLQSTLWLQNICQLFNSVERCLNALWHEGISALVHCSDGWDRTAQIVSLCMIIADPYYRTFEGFEMLIRRQWIEFGHKFSDRGGMLNDDENEKSPVFLQFLDCVYQLWEKNCEHFEFNRRYLMKLVQHSFSGMFGTFLFNSLKEAIKNGCDPNDPDEHRHRCFQVWSYLGKHNTEFRNPAYRENFFGGLLQFPKVLQDLLLWRDAYCCTTVQELINNPSTGIGSSHDLSSEKANLSRSQSVASLTSLAEQGNCPSNPVTSQANTTANFGLSSVTTALGHLTTKIAENCSIGLISSNCWQKCLDVDGLSRVPSQLEDKILLRICELEKQLGKAACTINGQQALREAINGKYVNGGDCANNSRRIRNESLESFEVVQECCRLKHHSSSSLTSVIQPSSVSSNSTTISSDFNPPPSCGFGGNNLSKSGALSENVESTPDGTENLEVFPSSNGVY